MKIKSSIKPFRLLKYHFHQVQWIHLIQRWDTDDISPVVWVCQNRATRDFGLVQISDPAGPLIAAVTILLLQL